MVVVRVGNNHGTGFLIDRQGWIITNHHVAVLGSLNLATGGLQAGIHFGRLQDQLINIDPQPYLAAVYMLDEERDLAPVALSGKTAIPR